jgi:dolichol-phosphate mannosyltransferase
MSRPTLSIVIPIYNEEAVIPELARRLLAMLAGFDSSLAGKAAPAQPPGRSWEVIFIDDGSRDRSLALLEELARSEPKFKIISFARNFGHQMAITAGLDRAEGDAVVVMDADLQDPPEVVVQMVEKWREGWDVVYGVRRKRKGETMFKRATAKLFYRAFRAMLGGVSIPVDAGDFRLMSRPAVLGIRALREQHRFVRAMVSWVGFRQAGVYYDRDARFAGETKYPLRKMVRFAVDGITSFSVFPLRIATWLGLLAGVLALGTGTWAVYYRIFTNRVVPGWTTIMVFVAFSTSVQLLMMGILGEYIGRIYEEVKRRPLYVEAKEVNFLTEPEPVRAPPPPISDRVEQGVMKSPAAFPPASSGRPAGAPPSEARSGATSRGHVEKKR